jgi:hypothetical protein
MSCWVVKCLVVPWPAAVPREDPGMPSSQAPSSLDLIFKVPPTTSSPTTALLFVCVTKDSLSNRRRLRSAPQWREAWKLDGTAPSNQRSPGMTSVSGSSHMESKNTLVLACHVAHAMTCKVVEFHPLVLPAHGSPLLSPMRPI